MAKAFEPEDLAARIFWITMVGISLQLAVIILLIF